MRTISPELALVDPQLAAAGRAMLPEPGHFRPAWDARTRSVTKDRAIGRPLQSRTARSRLGSGSRAAVVIAAVVAAFAAVIVGLAPTISNGGASRASAPDAAGRSPLAGARAAQQTVAARTYTWPAVPGAEVYEIKITRGGRSVFEATTRSPVLLLPAGLDLLPGRYTLSATPRSEGSSSDAAARPVVEETFQVGSS